MRILLATNNPNKVKELQEKILQKHLSIDLLKLNDIRGETVEIEEYGSTIEENAKIKASEIFKLFRIPSLADDTALEVDFLAGAPGVQSARFSGVYGDDSANRRKLLELLKDIPIEKRSARFRTVLCFVDGKNIYFFEGVCKGKIIFEERGAGGFGYDSIFMPDGYNLTFAEMRLEEKNRISHRAIAIEKFLDFINEYQKVQEKN